MRNFLAALSIGLMLLAGCSAASADDQMSRIQQKAEQAKAGVIARKSAGQDVSSILELMSQVQPALRAGKPDVAEATLDRVLAELKAKTSPAEGAGGARGWDYLVIQNDPDSVGIYDPS